MELLKSDFFYELPEELIAQTPVEPRSASRMMCVDRKGGGIIHDHFYNLCAHLKEGDLLVMNDSRVIPARLYGEKIGNGTFIEFLLLEQKGDKIWEIICRPGRRKPPTSLTRPRKMAAESLLSELQPAALLKALPHSSATFPLTRATRIYSSIPAMSSSALTGLSPTSTFPKVRSSCSFRHSWAMKTQ